MKFDVFFSICQTPVDDYMPTERVMFENFFDQVQLADELGYGVAWVAETHLSCQIQKQNPGAVIPHFEGEIGLNTDILQLAHLIFERTKRIHVGSAIRNILCNGGPLAHAEAIKTFLTLHDLRPRESRLLQLGFAAGRFPFSNTPYGIRPRNNVEQAAWPALKGKILLHAIEVFSRCLKNEIFDSTELDPILLRRADFRADADWEKVGAARGQAANEILIEPFWTFDKVGVIPFEAPLKYLRLILGSADAGAQAQANRWLPCQVFNLSITPAQEIEATHQRMQQIYHQDGGPWRRDLMPRTTLVFIDNSKGGETAQFERARVKAQAAMTTYWKALEGTLDQRRIDNAVDNALVGGPQRIITMMRERFHPDDRLMLWFDFFNHDNQAVRQSMQDFMRHVAPPLNAKP